MSIVVAPVSQNSGKASLPINKEVNTWHYDIREIQSRNCLVQHDMVIIQAYVHRKFFYVTTLI